MKHVYGWAIAAATLVAAPAQAMGFGYDYGQMDGSVGGPQGLLDPPTPYTEFLYEDVGVRVSARGHVFTWHDDSGILNAIMGAEVISNEAEKREEAERNHQSSYTYMTSGPIINFRPGVRTSLAVGFGNATGADLTFDNKTYKTYPTLAGDVKYATFFADILPFSLRGLLDDYKNGPPWMDVAMCFNLAAHGEMVHVAGTVNRGGADHHVDRSLLGAAMPVSFVADLILLPGLHIEPSVGYEVLGGFNKLRGVAANLFGVEGADDNPLTGQPLVYGLSITLGAPKLLYGHLSYHAIHSVLGDQLFDEQNLLGGVGVYF